MPPLTAPRSLLSWFVYVVRLRAELAPSGRDELRRLLEERGIGCGRYFAPVHLQPAYRGLPSANVTLPVTESAALRTLALPFFNRLGSEEIAEVCDLLLETVEKL